METVPTASLTPAWAHHGPARVAPALLFAFVFSLAFMQPAIRLLGFDAVASDFIFVALAALCGLTLLTGRLRIVADRAFLFIAAYLLAMMASAAARPEPMESAAKLATQFYLLSIPLIVLAVVRDEARLRKALCWWLAGTAVVALVAVASLLLFLVDPGHPLLDFTLFHFGTLPPGDYPRLRLTFLNANLACNYLTVSLMLLLAARHLQWIARREFLLLLGGILVAAAATISPGIGGVILALALWGWLLQRGRRPRIAALILVAGVGGAALFVAALALTPIVHSTAPFVVKVPIADILLAPSGRWLAWSDAVANFIDRPLLGRGIGADAVAVRYRDPTGDLQRLTDAHNMLLSIASQTGTLGLLAMVALIGEMVRRTLPLSLGTRAAASPASVVRLCAGLGLLNGLVYQGLGGSFEDARHLWCVFGLLLASSRIERQSASAAS